MPVQRLRHTFFEYRRSILNNYLYVNDFERKLNAKATIHNKSLAHGV